MSARLLKLYPTKWWKRFSFSPVFILGRRKGQILSARQILDDASVTNTSEVNNIIFRSNNMYFILFTPWSGENTNYVVFQLNAGYSAVTVHRASLTDWWAFCATAEVGVESCAGGGLMNQGFSCPNGIKTWRWGAKCQTAAHCNDKKLKCRRGGVWNGPTSLWQLHGRDRSTWCRWNKSITFPEFLYSVSVTLQSLNPPWMSPSITEELHPPLSVAQLAKIFHSGHKSSRNLQQHTYPGCACRSSYHRETWQDGELPVRPHLCHLW